MSAHLIARTPDSSPYGREDRDHSPRIVYFEVTRAIERPCARYGWRRVARHPDELSTNHALRLLSNLTNFPKPPTVSLVGGDPLERTDLVTLVAEGSQLGLEIAVEAAPTPRATPQLLSELKAVGASRLIVGLDGANSQIHDTIQQMPGAFRRLLRIAVDARVAGLSLQLHTHVSAANLEHLPDLARLAGALDVDLWSVQFPIPVGHHDDLPLLSSAESERAFTKLLELARSLPFVVKVCDAPHYRRFVLRQQASDWSEGRAHDRTWINPWTALGLNDGRGLMFVSHLGLIQPGRHLPLVCGSFPEDDAVQIYQHSPIFRALRDVSQLKGKCHWCEYRQLCGGSRARAFAVTGDPLSQEPTCSYRPRALG